MGTTLITGYLEKLDSREVTATGKFRENWEKLRKVTTANQAQI